jgi:thiamine biosynthesis lipoprotein
MNQNRYSILVLACAICMAAITACRDPAPQEPIHSFFGPTMGTRYTIRVANPPVDLDLAAMEQAVEGTLATVNQQMSTYLPDSELSRFNRHAGDDWFAVSAETALVVAAGLDVSQATDGAFDVTVGPLVNLWGFGPSGRTIAAPSTEAIAECRDRVGYDRLESRADPPALRKRRADLYVDLSAIAKGFAVDQIARLLERHAVRSYMVEIGGEVRTRGRKPDGSWWRIGIERPDADIRQIQCVVELDDRALATSGDYRNFFEQDGSRFSHEIDPRTGLAVDHALVSVSVLAADCMTADAWATALLVLGPEAALPTARREGLEALCIFRTPDGFVEQTTPGFAARLRTLDLGTARTPP